MAITAPISIAKVSSAIGCATNDVGTLCAKSLSGGEDGFAFKIRENGYTATDGYLIDGAKPYYNIFANNSPCEWVALTTSDTNVDRVIRCRLKRNTYASTTSSAYIFDLSAFNLYNHAAYKPQYVGLPSSFTYNNTTTNTLSLIFSPGEYSWAKLKSTTSVVSKLRVEIVSGGSVVASYESVLDDNESKMMSLSIDGSDIRNSQITIKTYLVVDGYKAYFPNILSSINIPCSRQDLVEKPLMRCRLISDNGIASTAYGVWEDLVYASSHSTSSKFYTVSINKSPYFDETGYVNKMGDGSNIFEISVTINGQKIYASPRYVTLANAYQNYTTTGGFGGVALGSNDTVIVTIQQI